MLFSVVVPVYNRPDEIDELLQSLALQDFNGNFEVVIVEDGSSIPALSVVEKYKGKLQMTYLTKPNTGPGDSRNYGMKHAQGDYFILFDSDCIVPPHYLSEVQKAFQMNYVDCFGGPDRALETFSKIQKAINFSMTSFLTTGGIRGGSEKINKFQPRSFNMGISKKAFEASGGFGFIHPGEDPDLSIRLWHLGFETRLFPQAYVYHKRRISWEQFYTQVNKFGKARPILDNWYPAYQKWSYYFPSLFIFGFYFAVLMLVFAQDALLKCYFVYFLLIALSSAIQNKSVVIGLLSVRAVWNQFQGYGHGFLVSWFKIKLLRQKPELAFPELFFKK